ncbi:Periaxin [Frankliniella fusca]|uniref:Periaxin n=1 Tax=Frankliniella fusca TaxID=407009 RepID=A0AAE1L9Z4_9NEOP|nr:Periaxin [Frankliniella fusca]
MSSPILGQHLVLVTDPEKGGEYAFDNPCFKDATPVSKGVLESKEPSKMDQKNKWTAWGGLGAIRNNLGGLQGEKRRAMDDSFPTLQLHPCLYSVCSHVPPALLVRPQEPQVTQVSLRSHDFTGLGFNICGNMRDGIFVKDVLHRGPASESGLIFPGDRIHGIRISLTHMVFEDALTILSYASPYEVTLEVETGTAGAASRPSSLLRRDREREKEKEALAQVGLAPADRIVHPFYRSQSIADLAQIGKGKRPHAIDASPARSETPNEYPTLKLHTSTPHAAGLAPPRIEHARHEQAAAVLAPSSSVLAVKPERGVHKLGVRVLPAPAPAPQQGSPQAQPEQQNVHNAYLERGIDVPDGYNPYTSTAASVPAAAPGFHDVDLRAASPDEHHKVGVVAKEVKTKISKGLHSLLHSLDRKKSPPAGSDSAPALAMASAPAPAPAPAPASAWSEPGPVVAVSSNQQPPVMRNNARTAPMPAATVEAEQVMTRKPSGRGIPTEIPEEVRLAAMAARSNRKSLGALSVEVVESVDVENRASSRTSSSSSEQKQQTKRKGLAPRPPSAPATPTAQEDFPAPAPAALVNGEDSLQSLPLHSDSDSEADGPATNPIAGPRTTIELTASHVTVHHSHGLDEETTRKAASLGDLSRIEGQLSGGAVLERAVSLDLDAPSAKKRKAPSAPSGGAEAGEDDDLSLDAMDEAFGMHYGALAPKEPRLDGGLNTFERSRLKKSSDWGTLEEALIDSDGDQVRVLTTAPTVAEVIPKGELKSSFFVGTKFGEVSVQDDQPFSFTASSMEPLSIEVRGEPYEAEASKPETPTTAADVPASTAERDRVLWSVPGEDGASRISVNSSSPSSACEANESVTVHSMSSTMADYTESSIMVNPPSPASSPAAVSQSITVQPLASTSDTAYFVSVNASVPTSSTVDVSGPVSVIATSSSGALDSAASDPSPLNAHHMVSSTPMRPDAAVVAALQSPIVTSSDLHRSSIQTGFVSTTQLNSLEDAADAAFLTAVDSSTMMHDAEDDDDEDLDDVISTPSPPLPTSPVPVSSPTSLTYITEIQVTTPDSSAKVLNGFSSPEAAAPAASPLSSPVPSPRSPSPPYAVPLPSEEPPAPAPAPSPTPTTPQTTQVNGDERVQDTAPAQTPATATTPKSSRNISVTSIQGSRIPVRAASHSPEDRGARGAGAGAAGGSPVRPPVPARRSTDLTPTPRKANGVQVVSSHSNGNSP